MTISTQRLRLLRGNSTAAGAFTGLQGELIFDTTLYTLRLQDGVTPGGYTLATTADLANVVAGEYSNTNVASYLPTYSGNLTAGNIVSGNILPRSNVTYSLGSATAQWKDLWLSNNTLYLGSIPITVTANGTLSVNGNVINANTAQLSRGAYIVSLEADGDVVFPGNIVSSESEYSNYLDLHKDGLGTVKINANADFLLVTNNGDSDRQWTFDSSGNIVLPSNSSAINYANGVSILNGITANGGPGNYSNSNVASYLPVYGGNIELNAITASGSLAVRTNGSNNWNFDNSGNLLIPGGGLIGRTYGEAGTIGLQPESGGYAIINSNDRRQYVQVDDSAIYIGTDWPANNFSWIFGTDGNLTVPNNKKIVSDQNAGLIFGTATNANTGYSGDIEVASAIGNVRISSTKVLGSPLPTLHFGWTFSNDGVIRTDAGQPLSLQATDNYATVQATSNATGKYGRLDTTADGTVLVTANDGGANNKQWAFYYNGSMTLPSGGQIGEIQYAGGLDLFAPNTLGYTQINYNNTNYIYADGSGAQIQTPNVFITAAGVGNNNVASIQVVDPDNSQDSRWNFYANGNLVTPNGGVIGAIDTNDPNSFGLKAGGSVNYVELNYGNDQRIYVDSATVNIGTNNQTSQYLWQFDQTGVLTAPGNIVAPNFIGNVTGNIGTFNTIYGTLATGSQTGITTIGTLTGLAVSGSTNMTTLQVSGNATIGNLLVTGNSTIIGNITQISGNSGQFFGNAGTGFNALYTGIAAGYTPLQHTIIQSSGNFNDYVQINLENVNSGNAATADYIVTADNGTDSTYYVDMGIASSNFDGLSPNIVGNSVRANDAYLYTLGNGSGNQGGNLIIGAGTASKVVKIIAGGGHDHDIVATVAAGAFTVNGNITGTYILGNGSQLTGITATTAVTAQYVTGLTSANVTTALGYTPSNYGDANVAVYTGNIQPGNINLSGIGASGRLQLKAAAGINGAYIYDSQGGIFLSPNTSYSATAGVIIGGSGYILGPNSSRNLTLNYNGVAGAVGLQTNVVVGTTSSGGNLTVANNITASGNITGNFFIGNGALLTGIAASSNYGNANVAGFLSAYGSNTVVTTGNVTAGYFIGNGALLTGIVASGSTYSNTNVAAYLASNSAVPITTTSNITAAYYFGNGSLLTGIVANTTYSNTNVASYLTGNIVVGNISGSQPGVTLVANTAVYTFANTGNVSFPGNLTVTTNVSVGNIFATGYYYANGAAFTGTGGSGNYGNANVAAYLLDNPQPGTYSNTNVASYLPTYTGTFGTLSSLTVGGQINQSYSAGSQGVIQLSDGVAPNYIVSVGSGGSTWGGAGSLNLLTYTDTPLVFFQNQSEAARIVSGGKILAGYSTSQNSGKLQVAGGISGTAFTWANGTSILDGISGNYGDANVVSMLSTNTNVVIGNINTYPIQANVTSLLLGNLTTLMSGYGLTANSSALMNNLYYDVNGALRYRSASASGAAQITFDGGGGVNFRGIAGTTTSNAAATVSLWATISSAGLSTSTGGITSGSGALTTSAATGTLFNTSATTINLGGAANVISIGSSSGTTTINHALTVGGGSLTRSGSVSAVQWTTSGAGLKLPAATYTDTSSSGTVAGPTAIHAINGPTIAASSTTTYTDLTTLYIGNAPTAGTNATGTNRYSLYVNQASYFNNNVTVVGNITAGNITATQYGNTIGTTATYTGNVTGNFFIGNGALLTGITATANYNDSNVATFLANIGSNSIATTGNITGNFFVGNGSLLTGIVASGSTYSNANVVSMLAANTYVALGNVVTTYPTASNITTVFFGNSTAITNGGSGSGQTNLMNNLYYDATNTQRYRNTQTGASQITMGGSGGFSFGGTTGSVTANAAAGLGAWATLSTSGLQTYNNINITSAGNLLTSAGVLNTGAVVSSLYNTTATTVNMGGAATTIAMGASTGTVTIGSGNGNLTVGNISAGGNITVGNVIGLTTNTTITAGSYTTTFDNAGNVTVGGNLVVNGVYAGYAPARAAMRVYGNTSTNWTAGTTLSNQVVDYNQGSYYSNSTGLFTAPIAGLYHCYATIRVGNNNALNQAALLKNNNTTGPNVVAFWETDTNAGVSSHFSITGYAKCVAGDTLSLKVIAGNVQFDSNDSWGVTYIG